MSVSRLRDSSVFSLAARPVVRGPPSLSLSLLVRPPNRHFFMALAPRFNVVTLLLIVMVGGVMSGPTPPGHTPSSTSEISISSSGEPRSTASVRRTHKGRHCDEKQEHADQNNNHLICHPAHLSQSNHKSKHVHNNIFCTGFGICALCGAAWQRNSITVQQVAPSHRDLRSQGHLTT